MPDLGSSGAGAIPPSSFCWGSSLRSWRPPPHRNRADQLLQAAFDRERLQVRKSLLEGKALLVEMLAGAPELQRHLPRGFLATRDDLENLIESPGVVSRERGDPARRVLKRTTVGGQDEKRFVRGHSLQPIEVFVERVGREIGRA